MPNEPVIVVDDNPINRKLLELVLSRDGYDVRSVEDADQALALLETFHPRLIMMDLQLPGMDGLELTRRLKADAATRDIVIIAVTAYALRDGDELARAAGCAAYLTKPISTVSLPALVARHLAAASAWVRDHGVPVG